MNGVIQVEKIDIQQPVIMLERTRDGNVNWLLSPSENILRSGLVEHVMLDQIAIQDGSIIFDDARRTSRLTLERVNATFAAPGLSGPWQSSGSLETQGAGFNYTANTANWENGRPLRFFARLSPSNQAGYNFSVEGESDFRSIKGAARIAPIANVDGKSDSEGKFRKVTAKAKLSGDFTKLDFSEAEIRPADANDQGTLLTGSGSVVLGEIIRASAVITAPRVDLDQLTGAGARALLRDGGGLALIDGLFGHLPDKVELTADLGVTALRAGGENLENAKLKFSANHEAVRIAEVSASMPGRTNALFQGVFFPGGSYSELGGNLALETYDARAFASWLWPEGKSAFASNWTGSRGHFKASSDVSLTPSKLAFQNTEYELDGEHGKGQIALLVNGDRPILNAQLDADVLDIDSFLSRGFSTVASDQSVTWAWLLQGFVAEQSKRDMRLAIKAGTLHLNGVEAKEVALGIETTVKGFELKQLAIGSVGGASVNGAGLFLNGDNGVDGQIVTNITAEDPKGLLRLMGILPRERDPQWTRVLGKTNAKLTLSAGPESVPAAMGFAIEGSSGEIALQARGSLSALLGGDVSLSWSGSLNSAKSSAFARFFTDAAESVLPAALSVSGQGSFTQGFKIEASGLAYNTNYNYAGMFNPAADYFGISGMLKVQTNDVSELARVIHLPSRDALTGAFAVAGNIISSPQQASLSGISGVWAGNSFGGTAALGRDGSLSATLETVSVSLPSLLPPFFLRWDESGDDASQVFPDVWLHGIKSEIWIRPKKLDLYPGFSVPGAEIGVKSDGQRIEFAAYAKSKDGTRIAAEISGTRAGETTKFAGQLAMPFDLAQTLKLSDGRSLGEGVASFDMKFEAEGRSPASALATINGSGGFSLVGAKLTAISPERFSAAIGSAKTAESLRVSLDAISKSGNGISFNPVFGSIVLKDGIGTISPFGMSSADADTTIKPVINLAEGQVAIEAGLGLKALPNLPYMSILFVGPPASLSPREDSNELSSFLGLKVLSQGVEDLEKVQAEQRRLAAEEEKMRLEDERRLADFYAQRVEIRLRQRELRIHAAQRVLDKAAADASLTRLIEQGAVINRLEVRQRLRELKFQRQQQLGGIAIPRNKPEL
jgi:AsmA-like C-terminal region